jgi:hypothetical protein
MAGTKASSTETRLSADLNAARSRWSGAWPLYEIGPRHTAGGAAGGIARGRYSA